MDSMFGDEHFMLNRQDHQNRQDDLDYQDYQDSQKRQARPDGPEPHRSMTPRDAGDSGALERRLEQKGQELQEMEITLRNVIESAASDKRKIKSDMARQIEVELFPMLDKMAREGASDVRESYRDVIKRQLMRITNAPKNAPDPILMRLTPTEMEICRYVQAGLGTKEIAEMMHSAFETIQTHRKNIRRKLELKGQKVSLCMFLQSRAALPSMEEPHQSAL